MFYIARVSRNADKNLMTVANLGVCFGPTLMRPEEETVAAIMDIKFCNIVIEIMVENYDVVSKYWVCYWLYKRTRNFARHTGCDSNFEVRYQSHLLKVLSFSHVFF